MIGELTTEAPQPPVSGAGSMAEEAAPVGPMGAGPEAFAAPPRVSRLRKLAALLRRLLGKKPPAELRDSEVSATIAGEERSSPAASREPASPRSDVGAIRTATEEALENTR